MNEWKSEISPYVSPRFRQMLREMPGDVREIRIRCQKPVMILTSGGYQRLDCPFPEAEEVRRMAMAMLEGAPGSRGEEMRCGYVTLPGGHRAGLCGRAALPEKGQWSLQQIASVNLRIAREVPGAAKKLHPYLIRQGRAQSLLVLSAPGGGKTTVLRDAARYLSSKGFAVGIVDERSELAACRGGVAALNVGENTDVLDGCGKAQGMEMMLRSMSPQVMITDELGGEEDAKAVSMLLGCGVAVLASAHASSPGEIRRRPGMERLLEEGAFSYLAVLPGVGEEMQIFSGKGERLA